MKIVKALLFSAALWAGSPSMAAGLLGTDVNFSHRNGASAFSPSTHTVVNGATDAALIDLNSGSGYTADLNADSLIVDFFGELALSSRAGRPPLYPYVFTSGSPNGLWLTSANLNFDFASIISSLTITNTGGFNFTKDRISLLDGGILFNFAGMTYDGNSGFTATFASVSSVPEPATWALMLVGFGGIGVSMRAARRKTAAALATA